MKFEITIPNFTLKLPESSMAGRFDELEAVLQQLITNKVQQIMSAIDDLRAQVERMTGAVSDAVMVMRDLAQQIADAASNDAALMALSSELSTSADALEAEAALHHPPAP